MNREAILQIIAEHRDELKRFGVKSLAIFGSVARGEADCSSDVDILVEFEETPTFDGYMELKFFLEDLLGHKVDLVMRGALKPWARETVLSEAIYVA